MIKAVSSRFDKETHCTSPAPKTNWFQNREHLGLKTLWNHEGDHQQFLALDLLSEARAVL